MIMWPGEGAQALRVGGETAAATRRPKAATPSGQKEEQARPAATDGGDMRCDVEMLKMALRASRAGGRRASGRARARFFFAHGKREGEASERKAGTSSVGLTLFYTCIFVYSCTCTRRSESTTSALWKKSARAVLGPLMSALSSTAEAHAGPLQFSRQSS